MKRELAMLSTDPPPGISCSAVDDSLERLEACIVPGDDTVYAGGLFRLEIVVPPRFPMQPPQVRFKTKIYHPNIDTAGRICLDALKMPPAGVWKPSLSLATVLTSIQLLIAEANPDDGLMADIAAEYKFNRPQFNSTARTWTRRFASDAADGETAGGGGGDRAPTTVAVTGSDTEFTDGSSSKRPCVGGAA
jgi:ubiquitin-conjugating enzyme E2 T